MAHRLRLEHFALLLIIVAAWIISGVAANDEHKLSFAPLLKQVTPAVVNVSAVSAFVDEADSLAPAPTGRRLIALSTDSAPLQSIGSGVIVDADNGLIVTNHHVVQNAAIIVVTLTDRRQLEATVVGSDAATDIALLHVDADHLTALAFGDSDRLNVGDFVIAIGNPFGLGQTATTGIVSALGRSGVSPEGYEDFIQTDASINPGSSGGPLIDLNGHLMGVNTAILSPDGGSVGIGFAIPSNMASEVLEQLREHGEMRRGRLGIMMQDVTPGLSEALQLAIDRGALVTEVEPHSPAETAGILAGDVIVELDGSPVQSSMQVRNEIGLARLGDAVSLIVLRDGARRSVRTAVADLSSRAADFTTAFATTFDSLIGAQFADIVSDQTSSAGPAAGALVTSVEHGSAAWHQGLMANDIVVGVNRRQVSSVGELESALEEAGTTFALQVLRGGRQLLVLVR